MMRLFRLLTLVLLSIGIVSAQTATVKRNVNLRPDPSTDNDPITKLQPPAQVHLIDPAPTNGFLHVRTGDGQEGWVWAKNVDVTSPDTGSSGNSGATTEAPADAISTLWEKPDPQSSVFHGQEGNCGETGDGGDADTNIRKNRIDVPATYHPVTWDAINNTPFPQGAPKSRANWSAAQLAQIKPIEGSAITVEGFLFKVKVEKTSPNAARGGESTNCHFRLADDVDWHMPLTAHSAEGENLAVIVETTPRIRAQHPNWTTANLAPFTNTGDRVRISGWLMLDPEHQDMIDHGQRSTLWEIHPVTKIEVFKNGQWVDLDGNQ
jgi:hypothetical protein